MRNFKVVVDGTQYSVEVEEVSGAVASAPVVAPIAVAPSAPVAAPKAAPVVAKAVSAVSGTKILAPMPGSINKIIVQSGTAIKKGQPIVVLEAMKMENEIAATVDGTVTVMVKAGDTVNSGDVLAVIA